jgi:tetratricopeptide (TPR) repeat protein
MLLVKTLFNLSICFLCLLASSCSETPEKIYQRLDKSGNEYFAAHNYQKALDAWNQMVPIDPNTPELFRKIGNCYFLLAVYDKALQAYNETLRLQPEDWDTRLKIAEIQLFMMDVNAAEESWDTIKNHLNTPEALIFHGDLLSIKKEHAMAEQEYRKVILAHPENHSALIRLTLCFLEQNKIIEAEKTFKILTELNPQSPDILLQMSNYLSLQGNQQQAESLIRKAIDLAPADFYLHIKLAIFLIESEKYDPAVTVLENLLQQSPDNRYVKKMLIEVMLLSNRDTEVKEILDRLTETEGKNIEFNFLKGKYFLKTMAYHAALSQFQMVLEKEPDFSLAYYFQGISYLAGGQKNLGEKSLIKCLILNPTFTAAELILADIYYKNCNLDLALEYAERIREREPGNFRAHLIMGNIYLAKNQYENAISNFQAAQQLNPELVTPLYYMALSSYLLGNTDKSLHLYQTLLMKDHNLADAALQYSRLLTRTERSNDAIQFLKNAISRQPSNHYLYHILGETYLAAGKREEASESFQLALSKEPGLKSSYLQLFALQSENEAQLEKTLLTAISSIRNFEEAQILLASLYCKQQQPFKAITLLEEALSAAPESPQLANNLAWLYIEYQQEDIDEAMRLAQKAYEALPGDPAVADTLGWIYHLKEMNTRALWLLEQAREISTDNPYIHFHLGITQIALGNKEKARGNLMQALEYSSRDRVLQDKAKSALNKIKPL